MTTTVVLVGHCGPDMFMLRTAVQRLDSIDAVAVVNDDAALATHLGPECVLLVNRVLDGRFSTESGIELIQGIAAGGTGTPSLLISNFADAQRDAEAAGAMPGFGKNALYDATTAERIQSAIEKAKSERA